VDEFGPNWFSISKVYHTHKPGDLKKYPRGGKIFGTASKSPTVTEVLPLMCLHGMSSGDFAPALGEFFGSSAGLSESVVTRLTKSWQDERERFSARSLADRD